MDRRPRVLVRPCLMVITDRRACPGGDLPEVVSRAVAGGAHIIQFREKDLPDDEALALGRRVVAAIGGKALFLVNGRPGIAAALGADGVHLPEDGPPVSTARELAGPGLLAGRSVHSLEGALRAQAEGADYVVFGPIYPTSSHPGGTPAGPAALREIVRAVRVPVIAVGGITAANAREVMAAGAAGAAVISAVMSAEDPTEATIRILEAMRSPDTIVLTVNGERRTAATPITLLRFLEQHDLVLPFMAVARNGEVVHRSEYPDVVLEDGDRLEIVRMVGGG